LLKAEEALWLPVQEIGEAIRDGSLSPVTLATAAIERAERLNPTLNCFVNIAAEPAIGEAHRIQGSLKQGNRLGPLAGIPYGLKDNVDTAGIPTTWGARPYAGRVPAHDAAVVTRLRSEGAVLIGKTSLTELAGGLGITRASAAINGVARNPWDVGRWTGGSSAGSAAAVAAGIVPFAVGTETSGSLMKPAACCGVTAFRPTYGAVSRHGVLEYGFTLGKVGPICRSARDCAEVLLAMVGRDSQDPSSVDPPPGLDRVDPRSARGMRVAVLEVPSGPLPIPPELGVFFEGAVRALEAAGLHVESAALPDLPWREVMTVILSAEADFAFEGLVRTGRTRELSDPIHAVAAPNPFPGRPSDYVKAMAIRSEMQRAMAGFFARFDFLLSCDMQGVAPPVDGVLPQMNLDPAELVGNLLGLPAIALPMGFVMPGRLPVGLMLTGPALGDAAVLAAGALYQARTGWHRERPRV